MNLDISSACFNRGYDCAMIEHGLGILTSFLYWQLLCGGYSNKNCLLPIFILTGDLTIIVKVLARAVIIF